MEPKGAHRVGSHSLWLQSMIKNKEQKPTGGGRHLEYIQPAVILEEESNTGLWPPEMRMKEIVNQVEKESLAISRKEC